MLTQVGGTRGDMAPFPIGEKRSSELSEQLDPLCGMEIHGLNGDVFRLVRLNIAAGLTATAGTGGARCGAFAYSLEAEEVTKTFDVQMAVRGGAKPINRVCGYGRPDQVALADNDYFWLHVDGPVIAGYLGDADVNVAVGDYIDLDDDADTGKVYGGGTTFSAEFTQGVSRSTEAGTDAIVLFTPIRKFQG